MCGRVIAHSAPEHPERSVWLSELGQFGLTALDVVVQPLDPTIEHIVINWARLTDRLTVVIEVGHALKDRTILDPLYRAQVGNEVFQVRQFTLDNLQASFPVEAQEDVKLGLVLGWCVFRPAVTVCVVAPAIGEQQVIVTVHDRPLTVRNTEVLKVLLPVEFNFDLGKGRIVRLGSDWFVVRLYEIGVAVTHIIYRYRYA
jgi:hypothetical protein